MIFAINDLKAAKLDSLSAPEKVTAIVCHILEKERAFDSSSACLTPTILGRYTAIKTDSQNIADVPENTISTMLSVLSHDANSVICCDGRRQGYYLDTALVKTKYGITLDANKSKTKIKEKDLYPITRDWLAGRGYVSADISSKHGGQVWRNPDVLGMKENDTFGYKSLEILTIEVKPSIDQWPIYLFEAVSHAMFANRAYFAFMRQAGDKIPDEMLTYAHQHNIGLMTLTIDNNLWEQSLGRVVDITNENCKIDVIFPAPYHVCEPSRQQVFLQKLKKQNITNLDEFRRWCENINGVQNE